jgi:hypothetical protein
MEKFVIHFDVYYFKKLLLCCLFVSEVLRLVNKINILEILLVLRVDFAESKFVDVVSNIPSIYLTCETVVFLTTVLFEN